MNWKILAKLGIVYFETAADEYKNKDDNDTGKDDLAGISLQYAADLMKAVLSGKQPPKAPAELR